MEQEGGEAPQAPPVPVAVPQEAVEEERSQEAAPADADGEAAVAVEQAPAEPHLPVAGGDLTAQSEPAGEMEAASAAVATESPAEDAQAVDPAPEPAAAYSQATEAAPEQAVADAQAVQQTPEPAAEDAPHADEMEVLPPDHPLLRRAQEALHRQLAEQKLRLQEELQERKKALKVRWVQPGLGGAQWGWLPVSAVNSGEWSALHSLTRPNPRAYPSRTRGSGGRTWAWSCTATSSTWRSCS